MQEAVLVEYGINISSSVIAPFGNGLINNTWFVKSGGNSFILQRINQHVFKNPPDIAENIQMIGEHLESNHPDYLFVRPCKTITGQEFVYNENAGYFRLFPFIKDSKTINVAQSPSQAYEAAKQFGRFTSYLSDFPVEKLKITLPDFHNLTLRFYQFEIAIKNGNPERLKETEALIDFLKSQHEIVTTSISIAENPHFKKRVTHHDCKINNVLFDMHNKGLCVIDLDTVMPGYFISDFGDMMRTYLTPVSEEEKDLNQIDLNEEYFKAITEGYLSEMGNELTEIEKKHMVYAGKFMTYMQALRFLTDYLNNDIYYGSKYEGHNAVRANNQAVLLKKILEKEKQLEKIIQ